MKSVNRKPRLKDLRTTLNVLASLDTPVPDALLIDLSSRIQQMEQASLKTKLNRMSEEQLIRFTARKQTKLRVLLPDGRLLSKRTNDETFVAALREIPEAQLRSVEYKVGRKPLLIFSDSRNTRLYKKYLIVSHGILVLGGLQVAIKQQVLTYLDQQFELNWEIKIQN